MGLVYEKSESGLLVARESAEGAAVAAALREHDRDLRLVPQFSESYGGNYWAVYRYAGSDRPADVVCVWVDFDRNEPKPLSMGLVDEVKRLDRNTRGTPTDSDTANARRREEIARQDEANAEALIEDWAPLEGRSACLPRSVSLRQARSRTGYHERKR